MAQLGILTLPGIFKAPERKTQQAACWDIYSPKRVSLNPGQVVKIPFRFSLFIPQGYEVQIRSRSSMAASGILIPNGVGTIDADYRGEVMGLFYNLLHVSHSTYPPKIDLGDHRRYVIEEGDRIAQMSLCRVPEIAVRVSSNPGDFSDYEPTERGTGGFGSTGR